MSESGERNIEDDDQVIWYRVVFDDVAGLLNEYELWKCDPWYRIVDWHRVSIAGDAVFQRCCRGGVAVMGDLLRELDRAGRDFCRADSDGLSSLVMEPIQITRNQLINGGHRSAAMRAQGVRAVPGMCMQGDVGHGIEARAVYPVASPKGGGDR